MNAHDVIVIGTSAGGLEALKELVSGLPADLAAAVFIVRHTPPDTPSMLPALLQRAGKLTASHAFHGEPIRKGHIFVAPPNHHMMIEDRIVSLTDGPKENRSRPAVDPLFRSAALTFGNRVVGVVLSGNLNDGTAGLLSVKTLGGISIVQNPDTAAYPGMPQSALQNVQIDHCLHLHEIAPMLVTLAEDPAEEPGGSPMAENLKIENRIARGEYEALSEIDRLGKVTPFTCPDCRSSLWQLDGSNLVRFRCRAGHAFTAEVLLSAQCEAIENRLADSLRAVQENAALAKFLHTGAETPSPRHTHSLPPVEEDYRAHFIQQALIHHNGNSSSQCDESPQSSLIKVPFSYRASAPSPAEFDRHLPSAQSKI